MDGDVAGIAIEGLGVLSNLVAPRSRCSDL